MKLLLDTHAFLWFILNDAQLSSTGRAWIADPKNEVLLSPVTYWELAIKVSLRKFALPTTDFETFMEQQIVVNRFQVLPITVPHAATVATLPFHHRDPFDRLLVAQALVEKFPLLSCDRVLDAYSVNRIW